MVGLLVTVAWLAAAVALVVAGHPVFGALAFVAALLVRVRISRSVGQTSPSPGAYTETTREFY